MKYIILLFFCMSAAFGQTVIHAITAPVNACGLAWDGSYLWCGAYGVNGDSIYKIDPGDGTVLKRLRWNLDADCYGLAFDGGDLWINDHLTGTDSIYRIDTITGARLQSFAAHKEFIAGLANDGTNLWDCVYYNPNGRAYKIEKTNGTVLDSFDITELPQPWGATWDGTYLWVCNDSFTSGAGYNRIYKADVVLKQIVDSLDSPGRRPHGLAWDGSYLWVIARGTSPTGFVAYQIDLAGSGTPDIHVTPMTYNYGVVPFDTSFSFWLNIANVGDDTLTIDTIYTLDPLFYTTPLSFPFNIADGADTNIRVFFEPDTFALYSSSLLIASNDPVNETTYVSLTGRGVYPDPFLFPHAASNNFGSVRVDCVKDWDLQIVNRGYPALVIDSVAFDDLQFFLGKSNLPLSVPCLDTVFIQVITRPDDFGVINGNADIFSSDPTSPTMVSLSATGDTVLPSPGAVLWSYDFPDNVVCVAGITDINMDGINDVACEAYDAGAPVEHLNAYWGNSSGHGVIQWFFGDDTTRGGWGDDCLIMGDDYSGDGIADIILGTAWGDRSVYAVNAVTGTIIWYYDSYWYDGEGGWVYSVKPMPDLNGDNIGEVLAGIGGNSTVAGGPRSMYCFSGADGQIIWQLRIGDAVGSVNWIPDVNNDNIPDAICGAWGNGYDEHVYCVSGASSGMVYSPLWSYDCGGDIQSVVTIPDQNGDGKLDVIAGTWSDSVFCLSGANGSRIWATYVYGDVTKVVEIPDLIGTGIPGIGVAHIGSSFQVLNASNGAVHWSYPIGSNVWTVDAIEDLDGDGKCDVVTGNQSPGVVYLFSGDGGGVIWSHNEGRLIYSVRAVDDISFDGHQDVLVGTQGFVIGRFFALCGGVPGTGIAEHKDGEPLALAVFPKIGRTSFNIVFGNAKLDEICIYDATGRRVKSFRDIAAGIDRVVWHANDDNGRTVAQGIYFVRTNTEGSSWTEKIVVVR
ncbi:MAG: PQQ-binding-like beta-propeller repeat protein [candidate division WOR-3 bacterium]|nr:MAG: PQQ-binding-like beta-propeller repeat protein [candidate division WOR-3 bacterium]